MIFEIEIEIEIEIVGIGWMNVSSGTREKEMDSKLRKEFSMFWPWLKIPNCGDVT